MILARSFLAAVPGALGLVIEVPANASQVDPQHLPQLAVVRVPELSGDATIKSAPALLRDFGLEPGTFRCDPTSGTAGASVGRVTAFSPRSGAPVPRGSKVDMVAVLPEPCHHFAGSAGSLAIIAIIQSLGAASHAHPPPPPSPPPPAIQACQDGSVILASETCPDMPPPPPPPPPPEAVGPTAAPLPDTAHSHHRSTAAHLPPVTDTTAAASEGPPETTTSIPVPPDALPAPDAQKGRGAFVDPGDMEVGSWHRMEFVVGKSDASLEEESEDQGLTKAKDIFVAPMMRVTLLPDPDFEIRRQSPDMQETGADRAASWQWSVKPLDGGSHALVARVEILEKQADGSFLPAETYTRRVAVNVRVGTWQGFLNALRGAATFGDVLGTLFSSWGKTLTALTALIAAAVVLWAAIRKLRQPKEE